MPSALDRTDSNRCSALVVQTESLPTGRVAANSVRSGKAVDVDMAFGSCDGSPSWVLPSCGGCKGVAAGGAPEDGRRRHTAEVVGVKRRPGGRLRPPALPASGSTFAHVWGPAAASVQVCVHLLCSKEIDNPC